MELNVMSPEFWAALASIIFIDLILAGDNAIVIGMAARKLPAEQQKKAVFWGMFGAIGIRILASVMVVWLLSIPGLQLAGGLLLVWIAYKLLINEDESHKEIEAKDNLWAAVRTIVIADAAMGVDNVIAVAGAAQGNIVLVIIGLLITVPVIIWGSTLFIKVVNRFPIIVYIGSGVLAYTAAKMITHESFIAHWFAHSIVYWAFIILVIAGVIAAGKLRNDKIAASNRTHHTSSESA